MRKSDLQTVAAKLYPQPPRNNSSHSDPEKKTFLYSAKLEKKRASLDYSTQIVRRRDLT